MGHPGKHRKGPARQAGATQMRLYPGLRPCRPGRAVSRRWTGQMSIETGKFLPDWGVKMPDPPQNRRFFRRLAAKIILRELDHRLAGRDLVVALIPHQHV